MCLRFVVVEDTADPRHDRPLLVLERAHLPTLRTRLLLAQFIGLLLRRDLQCARQQRLHGRHRHLFHLGQRHVKARPILAPVLPYDDFSPTPSQFLHSANIL